MLEQQQLFIENLPDKPYCSNDLSYGVLIRPLSMAIKMRHIQHNKPTSVSCLVLDLDSPLFWSLLESNFLPTPNLVAFNPENHHSHLYYNLNTPVYTCQAARAKPLRYLASIQYALCRAWDADKGYSGLISKNPVHQDWHTLQLRAEAWDLGELADWLDLPSKLPRKAQSVGLGRNCTLFDLLRYWAYDSVLEYRVSSNFKTWQQDVLATAEGFNTFPDPLQCNEVKNTANSVAKWVWKNYTKRWTDEEFSKIQAKRGRLGGLKGGRGRVDKDREKRLEAAKMRDIGYTLQKIADVLLVNKSTISRWLK